MTKYLLVEVDQSGRPNVPATSFDSLGGSNFLGHAFWSKNVSFIEDFWKGDKSISKPFEV